MGWGQLVSELVSAVCSKRLALVLVGLVAASVPVIAVSKSVVAASNVDVFGNGSTLSSPWWIASGTTVSQRYGCSDVPSPTIEPDSPPAWCVAPFNKSWHQGIDIPMNTGTPIISQVQGTIAASSSGVLGIRTNGGTIVYLLHGYPVGNFGTVGQTVRVGDEVLTSACVAPPGGSCTAPHLHFEIHASVVGELSVPTGPGDDVNPEGWLFRIPQPYGQQLTSWSAGDLGEFVQNGYPLSGVIYSSYGYSTGAWSGPWVFQDAPSGSGFYEYLSTDPVVISQSPNEWDAFALLTGGDLGWWSYANGPCNWQLISRPPGVTLNKDGRLTAVTRSDGHLDVFAEGSNKVIYHEAGIRTGSQGCAYTWYPWESLVMGLPPTPPQFQSEIVAVSSDDNNIYLVARDTVNSVWWTHLDNGSWNNWISIGGPVGSSSGDGLAAVAWRTWDPATGQFTRELDIFARSLDPRGAVPKSDLFNGRYTCATDVTCPSGWSGWLTDVSTQGRFVPSGQLVAVSWAPYRIDLFVRDQNYDSSDGWLWHNAYSANSLGSPGWTGYAGQTFYPPPNYMQAGHMGVVALGYGNIDIVAQFTLDRSIYRYAHLCYCNNTWIALPSGP